METIIDNESKIKELFKEALVESLDEPQGVFRKLFAEISEDIALAKAIEEVKSSSNVSRAEIFRILEGKA